MSAALLIPPGITPEHEAAVAGFDLDTQRHLLHLASKDELTVDQMLRYHRLTAGEPQNEKTTTAPVDRGVPQRAKRNRAASSGDGRPRKVDPEKTGTEPRSAREPSPPPRAAVSETSAPIQRNASGLDPLANNPLTVRATPRLASQIAAALTEFIQVCPNACRDELRRLRDMWCPPVAVAWKRRDIKGVCGARDRLPGTAILLGMAGQDDLRDRLLAVVEE